jgi:arylsulfatase A-like enzyme
MKGAGAGRRAAPSSAGLLLVCAALAAAGCGPAARRSSPRLVLLYATCTLVKSELSPYARGVDWTPRIDAFARRGVVFARHQTETGFSGIAFASVFSGSQAPRHRVFTHPTRIDERVPLITETFAQAGFDVWFWGDHAMASPALGYARGTPPDQVFSGRSDFVAPEPRQPHPEREAFLRGDDPRFLRLLDRLREEPERRALVVTNFTVTHAPYSGAWLADLCRDVPRACADRPEPFEETAEIFWRNYVDLSWNFDATVSRLGLSPQDVARMVRVAHLLYRANVHRLDGLFGDVVAAVESRGLLSESVIAFTADHGELLHREGAPFKWNHGFALTPESLGVPWLLVAPGLEPGRFEGVTRSIDVFPTLAGLAGVALPPGAVEGVDLAPALRGERPPPVLQAFSHTALLPPELLSASLAHGGTLLDALHAGRPRDVLWVSLRDGDRVYKIARSSPGGPLERRVFDLAADPVEAHDLHDPGDAEQARFFALLERRRGELLAAIDAATPRRPATTSLDLLRRLGYVD